MNKLEYIMSVVHDDAMLLWTELEAAILKIRLWSQVAATAKATAWFLRQHALKYRTSLATHLATAVAVAIVAYSDMALFKGIAWILTVIHVILTGYKLANKSAIILHDIKSGCCFAWREKHVFWLPDVFYFVVMHTCENDTFISF